MKNKRLIYSILCGVGGAFIGAFADKLTTVYGAVFFTLGVAMLVFSVGKLNEEK